MFCLRIKLGDARLLPEGVTSGRCIEDDHREIHPPDQLHHFCVAHCLVNARKGAQQLLDTRYVNPLPLCS
jgi:hypothetical protein